MTSRLLTIITAVVVAAVVAACSNDEETSTGQRAPRESDALTRAGDIKEGRKLSAEEVDTLVVWKERYHVTRDEYWEERGGVVSNEFFEVWYPPGNLTVSQGMFVLKKLTEERPRASELFGSVPDRHLKIICSWSLEDYKKQTGRDWWLYADVDDDVIEFQPVVVIAQRGLLDVAFVREYYLWIMQQLAGDKAPRWLIDGLASSLVNERKILTDNLIEFPDDPVIRTNDEIESALRKREDKKEYRMAMFNAFNMVERLAEKHGRVRVAAIVALIGEGKSRDEATQRALGMNYDDAVAYARQWSEGWER